MRVLINTLLIFFLFSNSNADVVSEYFSNEYIRKRWNNNHSQEKR